MKEFTNKHVVVTGGSGALGQALVTHLIEQGAEVWVPCYGDAPNVFPIASHAKVHVQDQLDFTLEEHVQGYYNSLPSLWASVQIAGGFSMANVTDTSKADFTRLWKMNTLTCFLSCQAAVRKIRETNSGGRIVNVAARPAVEPTGNMLAYTTSKAGVASLTQCLAHELSDDNILVNAVLPAMIDTAPNRTAMPDADYDTWPKVDQIAKTIAFLISENNALTSGALLPVYGKLL